MKLQIIGRYKNTIVQTMVAILLLFGMHELHNGYTIVSVAVILVTLLFVSIRYIVKLKRELEDYGICKERENSLINYNEMLMKQNVSQRVLLHDMRNHLYTMQLLGGSGDLERLNEYIVKLLKCDTGIWQVKLCDNWTLNLILNRYAEICREKDIDFNVDVRQNCLNQISDTDMTSIFCNLLDNCIEASVGDAGSFIDLRIRSKGSLVFVNVTNYCKAPPQSKNKRLITSKKNGHNHGYGMKSVEHTAKKYNGALSWYYRGEDKTFHTNVVLRVK